MRQERGMKAVGVSNRRELALPKPSAKAVQAAGRVIRSETDRGLIVLMDSRFLETSYSQSMPADWFDSDVREIVSDSILSDVASFWETER